MLRPSFSGDSLTGLFRPAPTDPTAQRALLDAVDMVLSPAAAASTLGPSGDGCLHDEEVQAVFSELPRGVSPGLDGLPYEFYVHFWPQLGPLFLAMANEALQAALVAGAGDLLAVLPPSMLAGLIVLLLKPGAIDARDLASFRPITLLNTDYRLLARVLVGRLAGPLASVLDVTQTAFVPGRWIGDNILCHLEEIAELQESDLPGCIVFLDWEKAYDRVVRGWLFAVLERMGFPPPAVSWVRLMLAGTTARVSLSGHYSAAFPVLSGVQQGSPLSCLLFNATVQPLAAAVRRLQREGLMRPIMLHGMHHGDLFLAVCYLPPPRCGVCPVDTAEWWDDLADEVAQAQALGVQFQSSHAFTQGTKTRHYADVVCGGIDLEHYRPAAYLKMVPDRARRRALAQLRTGAHWLAEETGRWQNVERQHRVCTHCASHGEQHVDTVQHFLFACPRTACLREKYPALFPTAPLPSLAQFFAGDSVQLASFARACYSLDH